MALYLGSNGRIKINLDGAVYCLNIYSKVPVVNGIRLVSSDGFILKDSKRLYLTTKAHVDLVDDVLLSLDDYILQDLDGLDLIPSDYY